MALRWIYLAVSTPLRSLLLWPYAGASEFIPYFSYRYIGTGRASEVRRTQQSTGTCGTPLAPATYEERGRSVIALRVPKYSLDVRAAR
ncbi:hypothetical protein BV898_05288 [Hypsibius exemplaris]|uniref:Secreted protein n=1 Tax=Hypsibius exemplaris TaxID=2072580 RepID=A0A1W0WZV1_HYPEX|nr:hypothetical protein BV898_05288 [Hypsibius exemplaris]